VNRDLFIIVNGGSGERNCEQYVATLRELANRTNMQCAIRVVRGGRQLLAATAEARASDCRRVIAAGGDGTLNAVAAAIAGSGKELGILPLGTFNYFAREYNVPIDLESAFNLCARGEARPISIGELNGHIFLNNASVGLYPKILEVREDTYRTWGRSRPAAYWSVLRTLLRFHVNLRAAVTTGHAPPVRLRTPMIFVGRNATQIDEFRLPGSDCVTNDAFAAYILPKTTRWELVNLAIRMYLGKLREYSDLKTLCAEELRVDLPLRWLSAAIDGERVRVRSPLLFRMRRNALLAVLPPAREAAA
jgi:diacylglycerol kinase family enzyme